MQAEALARDIAALLRMTAEPARIGELVAEQIRRAARRCGLPAGRAKRLWYGEAAVSGVDLVLILRAVGDTQELVVAFQNARALLLAAQLDAARTRR